MLIPFAMAAALRRIDIVSVYVLVPRWFRGGASGDLVFLSYGYCRHAAFAPHLQIAPDEGVEITIEHTVDVSDLYARAKVLRYPVGLENVAANLRAEVDLELRVLELLACRALLLQLVLI